MSAQPSSLLGSTATLIVAEDEPTIRNLFHLSLEARGYRVLSASDGQEAVDLLREHGADLVILDVMMPRMDGLTACRTIRQFSDVPVIIATVLNQPDDIEQGLSTSGADDYIIKPFAFDVLHARIQALLRRVSWVDRPPTLSMLSFDGIEFNAETREVRLAKTAIRLSPTESKLLHYLMSHANEIVPQEALMDYVWGYQPKGKKLVLHTNISRLRRKLEDNPGQPQLIETVAHFGYRFNGVN